MQYRPVTFLLFLALSAPIFEAKSLVDVVKKVKPSIVGIGVYAPLATVDNQLTGTGFVIGNGSYIVTNEHVINTELDAKIKSQRVVFVPNNGRTLTVPVKEVYVHEQYDIAIVEIGRKLPSVTLLSRDERVDDGASIAITGFPIGAVLGLYPATHAGIVAASTPSIIPAQHSSQISEKFLSRIKAPMMVYQLDLTAYPGNSGSPAYLAESGKVFGVINQVFVKETKEAVLEKPSGITYAIPISAVYELAKKHGIRL